ETSVGPESTAQREWKDLHQALVPLAAGRGGNVQEPRRPVKTGARLQPRRGQKAQRSSPEPRRRGGDPPRQPVRDVPLVAGERLVAAVAGECHRHVTPRLLRNEERGK